MKLGKNKLIVPFTAVILLVAGFFLLSLFIKLPQQASLSSGGGYVSISLITPYPIKTQQVNTPYGFYTVFFYDTAYYDSLTFTKITFVSNDGSMLDLAKVEHSIAYDSGQMVYDDRLFYQEDTGTTSVTASDVNIASDMAQAWHKLTFFGRTSANPDYPKTVDHIFYFGSPTEAPEEPELEAPPTTTMEMVEDTQEYITTEEVLVEETPYSLSLLVLLPIIYLVRKRKSED